MKLSANFSLGEMIKSQTALRLDIDNSPTENHLRNMIELCMNVLQPVRFALGPTIISSGYRSKKLNEVVDGSLDSQHCKGEAADIEVIGRSTYDVAKWIEDNSDFDQLILEFYDQTDPDSGWVHVSYKSDGTNRKQSLTAVKIKGKTTYLSGLRR